MPAAVGVVDLRDLSARYAWDELAISRFVRAAGLAPSGEPRAAFAPPPALVVVAPFDRPELLTRSAAWLGDAERLVVVRDRTAYAEGDPEVEELLAEEWFSARDALDVPFELVDWRTDVDAVGALALARARQDARTAGPHASASEPVELRAGPRIPVESSPSWASLERAAAALVTVQGERVTFLTSRGPVDLHDPSATLVLESDLAFGASHGGTPLVRTERGRWQLDGHAFEAPGDTALGFDLVHPVGWTGHRMMAFWLYRGRRGVGFLAASDHDFPCGPAKKLYGFEDNDPVGVSLAPDLGSVAYRFEHDVLLTSALPIAWREAGEVMVADFPRDPARAVFFARTADGRGVEDLLDEDARDARPALVLGPSAEVRYAVDLTHEVHRIDPGQPNEASVARVGGRGEGFAVFDHRHRLVRRASGRLLGGAWRWATLVEDAHYAREDLASGARTRLGPVVGEVIGAAPVPSTKNVVVVSEEGGRRYVALV